jgi:hypothetical protein
MNCESFRPSIHLISLMTLRKTAVLGQLCTDVLAEAKNPAGTWTLATHKEIDEVLAASSESDVEVFMSTVIKNFLSPESGPREKFKLAQICTMVRQKRYGNVEQLLLRYESDLQNTARNVGSSQLGVAIAQLIDSLFRVPVVRKALRTRLQCSTSSVLYPHCSA